MLSKTSHNRSAQILTVFQNQKISHRITQPHPLNVQETFNRLCPDNSNWMMLLFSIKDKHILVCSNVIDTHWELAVDSSSAVMIYLVFASWRFETIYPHPSFPLLISSLLLFFTVSIPPLTLFFVRHIFVVGLPECGSTLTGSALTAWHFPHLPPCPNVCMCVCVCGWQSL